MIEDDTKIVNLLKSYFEALGITCQGVLNGFKGLKELKRYKPKLILLNIILPDINGYEVMKKIRADNELNETLVFFLTSIPNNEIEKRIQD